MPLVATRFLGRANRARSLGYAKGAWRPGLARRDRDLARVKHAKGACCTCGRTTLLECASPMTRSRSDAPVSPLQSALSRFLEPKASRISTYLKTIGGWGAGGRGWKCEPVHWWAGDRAASVCGFRNAGVLAGGSCCCARPAPPLRFVSRLSRQPKCARLDRFQLRGQMLRGLLGGSAYETTGRRRPVLRVG
jgi:hypothetical protein